MASEAVKSIFQFDDATNTSYLGKTERGTYIFTTVASDVSTSRSLIRKK